MSKNRFERLYSLENLELAWRRINTTKENLNYKKYYRELFSSYESSLSENLKLLSEKIKDGSYEPITPIRFYKPKANGLLRPISFLEIQDQILYQAMANILIPDFIPKRRKLEDKYVFSNIFSCDIKTNIYLFQSWQEGYRKFKINIKKYFNKGYKYTAHFDLASFYDTIDHNSLTAAIITKTETDFSKLLKKCLEKWSNSSNAESKKISHSIPQGPLASCVFSELFLLQIDENLVKKNILFSRYVDDIVIQSKTKNELLKNIVFLEINCKERGLIPQSNKLSIFEAQNSKEAVGKPPSLSSKVSKEIFIDEKILQEEFNKSIQIESYDSSFLRYTLKTFSNSDCLVNLVLSNFFLHYELAEDFLTYLKNFTRSITNRTKYIDILGECLLSEKCPYNFVEGQLWIFFAKLNQEKPLKDKYVHLAIQKIKNNKTDVSVRHGIYYFLSTFNDNRFSRFLQNEKESLLMLLQIKNFNSEICKKKSFNDLISRYKERNIAHIKSTLLNYLNFMECFGFITSEKIETLNLESEIRGTNKYESIETFLKMDYGVNLNFDWHKILIADKEYKHASNIMRNMHTYININRTSWLNLTDSFNDLILKKTLEYLKINNKIQKYPTYINKNGKLLDFGNVLGNCKNSPLAEVASHFDIIHQRRNSTPLSHAQDLTTKINTSFLKCKEQYELKQEFKFAIEKLIILLNKYLE